MVNLDEVLAPLSPAHREALLWFVAHAGNIVTADELKSPPASLKSAGVKRFDSPAEGIWKPAGWRYALSVKETLKGRYPDQAPVHRPDGTWVYRYHQRGMENTPSPLISNQFLRNCLQDGVPVGVIRQIQEGPARYRIHGIALVTGWANGFFLLEGFSSGALAHSGAQAELSQAQKALEDEGAFDPATLADNRDRVMRAIARRQGQKAFREKLLAAYGHRCAITGCPVVSVLQAAHIHKYSGPDSNHIRNGLLLRSDIHDLFDLGLIGVDPETMTVLVSPLLEGSEYEQLAGKPVRLPSEPHAHPSKEALAAHRQQWGL